MENVIAFLRRRDRFLLATHRRPDGDTLGSAAALCAGLRALGKTACLWRNPEVTERYLPYTERYFAPEGYTHETAVTVDVASASQLGVGWDGPVHLRIDHHPDAGDYAELDYTDSTAAACGEVVYDLLRGLGAPVTKEIAAALYIAVATDTGCFRYANTTARTYRMTAELLEAGADAHSLNAEIFGKSRQRLAAEAAASSGLEYGAGGRVAITSLTLAQRGSATEDDLENLAGLVQGIKDVVVGVFLREGKDGWRVSCRTAAPYAADRICRAFGGGGHLRAAGGTVRGPLSPAEARARVLGAIWETYPELRD
ncbi:MAG: bifunctional oligoribonuclease/PAP phosphatase NrnA [Oscillospiraceae bacterium]|jgi:phosphoesterase RecJ-like protein|nr:bifunctional oligoribonuclease/PAP phosphatase NrnA [Oscillospiraceae bacterium]